MSKKSQTPKDNKDAQDGQVTNQPKDSTKNDIAKNNKIQDGTANTNNVQNNKAQDVNSKDSNAKDSSVKEGKAKNDKEKNKQKSQPSVVDALDPAEQDAIIMRRRFPISWLLKLLLFVLLLFLVVVGVFYYAAGTNQGTKFFFDKISSETGIQIDYGAGNLKDGVKVQQLHIPISDNMAVDVKGAYVKIGWRSLFMKQVHFRQAHIDSIKISNSQPPSGQPFDYATIKSPVDLYLDDAAVGRFSYEQVNTTPIVLNDITANKVSWRDTQILLGAGKLRYADLVGVNDLSGKISLTDDYPLQASASISVDALSPHHFDAFKVDATGSLKNTQAKIRGKYAEQKVVATASIQALAKGMPFKGKINWDKLVLPYAESQKMTLKSGEVKVDGGLSNIDLQLDSQFFATNLPSGRYQGTASIDPTRQMQIEQLTINTDSGKLQATGLLDWQDVFTANITAKSRDYQPVNALPEEYREYQGYLPNKLDGDLSIHYLHKNADGLMQIESVLKQKVGEQLKANIVLDDTKTNQPANTWLIDASWKNYQRDDAPFVGVIDSDYGRAKITFVEAVSANAISNEPINQTKPKSKSTSTSTSKSKQPTSKEPRLLVTADAHVNALYYPPNQAPEGNYHLELDKQGLAIDLTDVAYQGSIGEFTGVGKLQLVDSSTQAQSVQPQSIQQPKQQSRQAPNLQPLLTWQMTANTKGLKLKAYRDSLPITNLVGDVVASGSMSKQNASPSKPQVMWHHIKLDAANLTSRFDDRLQQRHLNLNNTSYDPILIDVAIGEQGLQSYAIKLDADVASVASQTKPTQTQNKSDMPAIPTGHLLMDMHGSLTNGEFTEVQVKQIRFDSLVGNLDATAKLDLTKNVLWEVDAKLNKLKVGEFLPKSLINGKRVSVPKNVDKKALSSSNAKPKPKPSVASIDSVVTSIVTGHLTSKGKWIKPTDNPRNTSASQKSTQTKSASQLGSKLGSKLGSQPAKPATAGKLEQFSLAFDGQVDADQLPQGQFLVDISGDSQAIDIHKFEHTSDLGSIKTTGKIATANGYQWDVQTKLNTFNLGYFLRDYPSKITGQLETQGTLLSVSSNGTQTKPDNHKNNKNNNKSKNNNDGNNNHKSNITTQAGILNRLKNLRILFTGDIDSAVAQSSQKSAKPSDQPVSKLPSGQLKVDVEGDGKRIKINQLNHTSKLGNLDVTGDVQIDEAYRWQLAANMQQFDLGEFIADYPSHISGKLNSTGSWHPKLASVSTKQAQHQKANQQANQKTSQQKIRGRLKPLGDFTLNFDGEVDSKKLPNGQFSFDVAGNNQQLTINQLRHEGSMGLINAKGNLDIASGYDWTLDAQMQSFNLGFLMPEYPSDMTGRINSKGSLKVNKHNTQAVIDVSDINLSGSLKQQKLQATGALLTKLQLPTGLHHVLHDDVSVKTTQPTHIAQSAKSNKHNKSTKQTTDKASKQTDNPINAINLWFAKLKQQNLQQQVDGVQQLVDTLKADDFLVQWGSNKVQLSGTKQQMDANIQVTNLKQLHNKLRGQVLGSIKLDGMTDALPNVVVDLTAKELKLATLKIADAKITGHLLAGATKPSELNIKANNLEFKSNSTGKHKGKKHQLKKLQLRYQGKLDAHNANLTVANTQMNASLELRGGYDVNTQKWTGVLGNGQVGSVISTLQQLQPAQVIFDVNAAQMQLASHCWQSKKMASVEQSKQAQAKTSDTASNLGQLCLRKDILVSKTQGDVDVVLQNIDTALLSLAMPNDMQWRAKLNGAVKLNWQKGQKPHIQANMSSTNGRIGLIQDADLPPVFINYKRIGLTAKTKADDIDLRLEVDNGKAGGGYADISIDPYQKNKPIKGALVLENINMAVFKPFFPGLRILEGKSSLSGGIGGSLSKPIFIGDFDLTDGHLALLDVPVNLTNLEVHSQINSDQANIEGSFKSGEGLGKLSGQVNWQQALQIKLTVSGEQLDIAKPPALVAKISPDIDVVIQPADKYVKVQGVVLIPSATIRPVDANPDIVQQSDKVFVIDRRLTTTIDELLAESQPWDIDANIGVDLGDAVNFRGFGAEIPLAGALVLTQQGQDVMRAKGVVQVSRRTNVDALGQSLALNYAQVRFNGDVRQPDLSIEAVEKIGSNTVGMRIKGNTNQPSISVFNDAGLNDQEAMHALVTGRIEAQSSSQLSEEGFRSEISNNIAAAGLSVGFNGTRKLTNQIGRAVGLQGLTLTAAGNQNDTNVNVTGYITPDLYIRYGIGVFSLQNSLSMRYQLTRRVYVEATSATENLVDVVYRWQF